MLTPNEEQKKALKLVKGGEWDEIKGVLGTFSLNQHRVKEAYEEAVKHIEVAVASLLSHQLAEARREQHRLDVEAVNALIDLEAYYTKVVDCSVVPAHLVLNALDRVKPESRKE